MRMLFAKEAGTGADAWAIPYVVNFSSKPTLRFRIYRSSTSMAKKDLIHKDKIDPDTVWDSIGGTDWNSRLRAAWESHFGPVKPMPDYPIRLQAKPQKKKRANAKHSSKRPLKKMTASINEDEFSSLPVLFERGKNLSDDDLKIIGLKLKKTFKLATEPPSSTLQDMLDHRQRQKESPLTCSDFANFCARNTITNSDDDDDEDVYFTGADDKAKTKATNKAGDKTASGTRRQTRLHSEESTSSSSSTDVDDLDDLTVEERLAKEMPEFAALRVARERFPSLCTEATGEL